MKKLIAITGGIGSGKSSAAQILLEMGYPVFSCDEIYREVILSPAYIQKVYQLFPECIIDGNIDKKILAQMVFADKSKLALLNGIAHPLIMGKLFDSMHNCNQEIVFAEASIDIAPRTAIRTTRTSFFILFVFLSFHKGSVGGIDNYNF